MTTPTDVKDPTSAQVSGAGASQQQAAGVHKQGAPRPPIAHGARPSQNAPGRGAVPIQLPGDHGDVELLTSFLLGLLLTAPDLVMSRIRDVRGELATHPELMTPPQSLGQASARDLARYLAIGLSMRGQDRLLKGARRGAQLSVGTASWALGFLDRATGGWLMRPLRRPVETRLRHLARRTGQVIREGQMEEQKSRLLAQEAVYEIVDNVIEFAAENPEVAAWIREVIGGQSVSLATAMRDNARQLTVASDGHAEALVRKLLRRPPRRDLPESPLSGKPQTMYNRETAGQEVSVHEQLGSDRQ